MFVRVSGRTSPAYLFYRVRAEFEIAPGGYWGMFLVGDETIPREAETGTSNDEREDIILGVQLDEGLS